MKPTPLQWFAVGAALAAAGWIALYPRGVKHTSPPIADVPAAAPSWTPDSLKAVVDDLNAAKTAKQKLAAVARLDEIPIEEIPGALGTIETVKNRQLTFAARTLLMRWGSKDGLAAMSWAWKNLGKSQAWNEALGEIGPAWAWRDPEGFAKWIKATMDLRKPELTLSPATAEASDDPLLDMTQVSKAVRWLVAGKPSAAFEILRSRPGWSSDDHQLVDRLITVEQVREALLAFDGVDRIDPIKLGGDQVLPMSLLSRWKKLDPEDFARSPYRNVIATKFEKIDGVVASWKSASPGDRSAQADAAINSDDRPTRDYAIFKVAKEWITADPAGAAVWLESLPDSDTKARNRIYAAEVSIIDPDSAFQRIASLPPPESGASMSIAFDAWRTKLPGQLPDMSGWTSAQRRDWTDLEAIGTK